MIIIWSRRLKLFILKFIFKYEKELEVNFAFFVADEDADKSSLFLLGTLPSWSSFVYFALGMMQCFSLLG